MPERVRWPLLCIALVCASAPAPGPSRTTAERVEPAFDRVLLVSIDTARRDRLGPYGGSAATPHLNALAGRGAVFEHAYAPTPVTLPSHASLFTGLYPPAHGLRDNARFHLAPEALTVAERFQAAGFRTAAFVSAFVLDAQFGLDQGFEVYEDRFQSSLGGMPGREERDASATTEMALRWLNARGDAPWFVFLHYFDAHHPYNAPARFRAEGVHPYDAELAYVDVELGRVLAYIESRGWRERTLVVVTADHGEALGDHGEATHGTFVYDSTIAVPLIVSGPGVVRGERIAGEVSLVDLAPTLLALAGLPALPKVHGQSLAAALAGQAEPAPAPVYAEAWTNAYSFGWSPLAARIAGREKVILAPRSERYDLARDPGELRDLAAEDPAALAVKLQELERWYAELQGAGRGTGIQRVPSDAEQSRLAALGYTAGAAADADARAGLDPKDGRVEYDLMQRAGALHDDGRLSEALALYERILARNPRNATIAERAGIALVALGRPAEGIERLAALDLFPGTSLFTLAQAYAQVGQPERTLEIVRDLRQRNPKFMPAHLFFAELHERAGERELALEAYTELLRHWHGDPAFRLRIEQRLERLREE